MSSDLAEMTASELRDLISEAQSVLAGIEAEAVARQAVADAVDAYADSQGLTTLEAWRALAPEGVEVPDDPEPEPAPDAPEWVQPQAHNPYMKGDLVTYKGVVYECTRDDNVWSPLAYPQGWKEVR